MSTYAIETTRFCDDSFGEILRRLMRERRFSFAQLGYLTHVNPQYLNHITKGKRGAPSDDAIERVAARFGLPPDYFVEYRQRRVVRALEGAPELVDELYARLACERDACTGEAAQLALSLSVAESCTA